MTPTAKSDVMQMYHDIAQEWENAIVASTKIKARLKKNQPELMATPEGKAFYFAVREAIQETDAFCGMLEETMDETATWLTTMYNR